MVIFVLMYKQIIKFFNRDTAFRLLKWQIRIIGRVPFARAFVRLANKRSTPSLEREVFNHKFSNPIGLGPGLDKDGLLYNTMSDFGYSFVDIGPVNSSNIKTAINHLQDSPADTFIALCINKDHVRSFSLAYDFADMFVFEIPDDKITETLDSILDIRLTYDTGKPILLRLTHALPEKEFETIMDYCLLNGVDGVVAAKADYVRSVNEYTKGRIPIIGYGGVRTPELAREMLDAGASLIEITTGLVLDGPTLVKTLLKNLEN